MLADDGTLLTYDLLGDKAGRARFDDSSGHHISEAIGGVLMLGDLGYGGYRFASEAITTATTKIPEEVSAAKTALQQAGMASEKSADYATQADGMRSRYGETPVKPRRAATIRELDSRSQAFAQKQTAFNKLADEKLEKVDELKRDLRINLMKDGTNYLGESFSETMIARNLLNYYEREKSPAHTRSRASHHPGAGSPLAALQPSSHSAPGHPRQHYMTIHVAAKFGLNQPRS